MSLHPKLPFGLTFYEVSNRTNPWPHLELLVDHLNIRTVLLLHLSIHLVTHRPRLAIVTLHLRTHIVTLDLGDTLGI